jgi:hypothetical protein
MKIRYGFVSNSSTTSFCIYGNTFNSKDINEDLQLKAENEGFEVHNDPNDDYTYIGRSVKSIKDDETGKQFKENTLKLMKKVFPEINNLSFIEEGWYNG